MKKLIYCVAALATAFFAGSCQKENFDATTESTTVTYTVELPGVATKATADERWIGDGNNVNQLIYEVWRTEAEGDCTLDEDNKTYLLFRKEAGVLNGKSTISLDLVNNQNYTILFWAQVKNTGHYNTYNLQTTDLRNIEMISRTDAFDESRAAFFGVDHIKKSEVRRARQTVKLTRPFGQINLGTIVKTEAELGYDLSVENTAVTVSGVATAFNVATGAAVNDKQIIEFSSVEPAKYAETYPESTKFAVNSTEYQWISMNYIFVPQGDKSTVEVSFDINTNHGLVENTISNVPVKVNYKTNIVGNLLTSGTEYEVILENSWSGAKDVNVWDGSSVAEPAYDEQTSTYTIKNGAELAWLAAAVNGTLPEESRAVLGHQTFVGQTFVLANDIYLGNHDWTPISMSNKLGAGETFRGTFDGNGKTISGLNVNQNEVAGLFGYVFAATIKNVTIEGASINSNHFAGGLVAWVNNSTGNIQVPFVLENCHVKNSTITSTPELVNGEWDNGDKVGGLVGHAYFGGTSNGTFYAPNQGAKISGCSVDNTTIKAYRDFAGLVGYASYVAIENSTTTNVTLEQDLTHDYKAPNTPTTYGLSIGRNEGGNTIDGKEYSTDGYTIDAEGNFHIYNAAGLKWVSENVNTMEFYVNQAANIFDNKTVYIENDIDFQGAEWRPIGDYAFSRTSFNGVFDGQNHTISNFKVTNPVSWTEKVTEASYGFFGNVKGTVKNLTVKNATVNPEGGRYSAALVGRLHNGGRIENCHVVESSVTINHWQVGGIVGQNNNGNISNCSVTGSTITGKAAVGAIVGMDMIAGEHIIENCRVTNSALAAETIFEGYEMTYGLAVGLVNASGIILNLNNVVVENNTIKGVAANTLVGEVVEGAKVYVNGSIAVTTAAQLEAAIKAGGEYILMNDVAMTAAIAISNANFTLDGNGYTVTMAEDATNTYALFDITGGKAAFKNVTFDGVKSGAVVRTVGVEFNAENVTAQNGQHTQEQGLFRLLGKSTIKNCTFKNNTCRMVITLNYDGASNTPQVVENCVFEGNTCNATAVLYYVKGESATINGNKFIGNTVNCSGNGATVYMGFTENNVVTNNLFQDNTVNEADESSRVAGGIFFGYETEFTGNAFVGNKVTGKNAKGNDVCVSTYYTSVDLSGNYWNGRAPIEDVNYFVQHKSDERVVIINDFLKVNPFNN